MSACAANACAANACATAKPHYILKLFIDSDDSKLVNLYKESMHENNAVVQMYLDGAGVHFDAGFDLFCPAACIIAGRETGKLNHRVKTAMEFSTGGIPSVALAASPRIQTDLMSALEFIVSTTANSTTVNSSENNNYINTSPVGYYLYPRSSTGTKTPLRLANSVGIIDSGYRGHIIAAFDNWKEENYCIEPYHRMAQLCPPNLTYPVWVQIVDSEEDLGLTKRGEGGFGSTGK